MTIFERSEYMDRIRRTRQRMEKAGIDVLMLSAPENIYHLTGYAGWSFYIPQMALLPADDEEPVLIVRDMDTACADHSAFLESENVVGYPEDFIGSPNRHAMSFVADFVRKRRWGKCRLGIEMDAHFLTARAFAALRSSLPDAEFVDATCLVNWVRTYKSDAEIEIMRQAGRIADQALLAAYEHIAPGVRECDVAAEMFRALIRGTPEFGGGVPENVAMPAGVKAAAPHLPWSDSPYSTETGVNIELGGCRHQYHAGLARTIYLGRPPAELRRLSTVVLEGLQAALTTVRPGVLCEELVESWENVIARAGYHKASRIGYAIGTSFRPAWIEQTASLQRGDKTVLEPNMTFHLICGMWKGQHNLVMSETFRVTETGHERLTNLEQKLFVKD